MTPRRLSSVACGIVFTCLSLVACDSGSAFDELGDPNWPPDPQTARVYDMTISPPSVAVGESAIVSAPFNYDDYYDLRVDIALFITGPFTYVPGSARFFFSDDNLSAEVEPQFTEVCESGILLKFGIWLNQTPINTDDKNSRPTNLVFTMQSSAPGTGSIYASAEAPFASTSSCGRLFDYQEKVTYVVN